MANGPVVGAAIISMVFLASIFSPGGNETLHQTHQDVQLPSSDAAKPTEGLQDMVIPTPNPEYSLNDIPPPVNHFEESPQVETSNTPAPASDTAPVADVPATPAVEEIPIAPAPQKPAATGSLSGIPLISDLAAFLRADPARAFLIEVGMTGFAIVACLYVYFSTANIVEEKDKEIARKNEEIAAFKLKYQNAAVDTDEAKAKGEIDVADVQVPKEDEISDLKATNTGLKSTIENLEHNINTYKKKLANLASGIGAPDSAPEASLGTVVEDIEKFVKGEFDAKIQEIAELKKATKQTENIAVLDKEIQDFTLVDQIKTLAGENQVELSESNDVVTLVQEIIKSISAKSKSLETTVIEAKNSELNELELLKDLASDLKLDIGEASDFKTALDKVQELTVAEFDKLKEEIAALEKKNEETSRNRKVDKEENAALVVSQIQGAAASANIALPESEDVVALLETFVEAQKTSQAETKKMAERVAVLEGENEKLRAVPVPEKTDELATVCSEIQAVAKDLHVTVEDSKDPVVLFEHLVKSHFSDVKVNQNGLTAVLAEIKKSHEKTRLELDDVNTHVDSLTEKARKAAEENEGLEARIKLAESEISKLKLSSTSASKLPKVEAPKTDATPAVDAPKAEHSVPAVEAPKVETKVEAPKNPDPAHPVENQKTDTIAKSPEPSTTTTTSNEVPATTATEHH